MKRIIFILFFSLLIPNFVLGIAVNEIAWMGTATSANDEWIELYNNTDSSINIDGWVLKAADGTPDIELAGTIPAKDFYLLERTDDDTVPGITADFIYKGALGNTKEDLRLYDNSNNLIDEVNCSEKWLAGDNATKQTMEKNTSGWQMSEKPGGTPRSQNSAGAIAESTSISSTENVNETPAEAIGTTNGGAETASQAYADGIVLNEILPSPEGADEENEWIEIYNTNNSEADLSGWKIEDSEGTKTTYSFAEGIKISANGYILLKRPDTKITLNNSIDGLKLLWPDGKTADSLSYSSAPKNQSYNRYGSNWAWSFSMTPGSNNIIAAGEIKNDKQGLPNIKKSGNSNKTEGGLGALSQSAGQENIKNSNPWFLFLTAIVITLISAAFVLFIKLKLNKNVRT